jgi:hypothetical protein
VLTIYRRHLSTCTLVPEGRAWRKCQRPICVQGRLGDDYIAWDWTSVPGPPVPIQRRKRIVTLRRKLFAFADPGVASWNGDRFGRFYKMPTTRS